MADQAMSAVALRRGLEQVDGAVCLTYREQTPIRAQVDCQGVAGGNRTAENEYLAMRKCLASSDDGGPGIVRGGMVRRPGYCLCGQGQRQARVLADMTECGRAQCGDETLLCLAGGQGCALGVCTCLVRRTIGDQ